MKDPSKELLKYLKECSENILGHTDECYTIIVGGLLPSCPDNPDYWRGAREEWICSDKCPIKKETMG